MLTNRIDCGESRLRGEIRVEFEKEVERWIDERILILWSGKVEGIQLLQAVVHPTKKKVRPVLYSWVLNKYVAFHTRDGIDVCEEVIREWRRMEWATKIVDLKSAYLQIHLGKKLWRYQLVEYEGQIHCLNRLGFGLSFAKKIMTAVLKMVLTKDNAVKIATSSYIDNVLVEEAEVTVEKVIDHVNTYGLTVKPSELLGNWMALGLKLQQNKAGKLMFRRGKSRTAWPSENFSQCVGSWLVITP